MTEVLYRADGQPYVVGPEGGEFDLTEDQAVTLQTGPLESFGIGMGRHYTRMYEGAGNLLQGDFSGADPDPERYQMLKQANPISTTAGEIVGGMFPPLPGGLPAQMAYGGIQGLLESGPAGGFVGTVGAFATDMVGRVVNKIRGINNFPTDPSTGRATLPGEDGSRLGKQVTAMAQDSPLGMNIRSRIDHNRKLANSQMYQAMGGDIADLGTKGEITPSAWGKLEDNFEDAYGAADQVMHGVVPEAPAQEGIDRLFSGTKFGRDLDDAMNKLGGLPGEDWGTLRTKANKVLKNSSDTRDREAAEQILSQYYADIEQLGGPDMADLNANYSMYKAVSDNAGVNAGGDVQYRSAYNQLRKRYGRNTENAPSAYELVRQLADSPVMPDSGTATRSGTAWGNPLNYGAAALTMSGSPVASAVGRGGLLALDRQRREQQRQTRQ